MRYDTEAMPQAQICERNGVEPNPETLIFHVVLTVTLGHFGEIAQVSPSLTTCDRLHPSYFDARTTLFWCKHEADNDGFRDRLHKASWDD